MKTFKYENSLTYAKNCQGKIIDKIFEKTMETCVWLQVLSII